MIYQLRANELSNQTLFDPKDDTSLALSDGWASCGLRSYKLKEGADVPAYATILTLPLTN